MKESEIRKIVDGQREFFHTGATLPVEVRVKALARMKKYIKVNEAEILAALKADLGKSASEAYMCEVGLALSEITHMLKHIRSYAGDKKAATPLHQFPARSYKKPSPYGVVLIMSPWNYPFLLTVSPLIYAIAAGNTAVIKPSAYSPGTGAVIEKMMQELFPAEYVATVTGGRAENQALLNQHFDYIFFTGSQAVGKEVMRRAADHLTPVTLELGGKSPVIIARDADIPLAARRVVFGKYLNLGQTCVAPDYILCDEKVKKRFIKEVKRQIRIQYGENPIDEEYYGKIINEKHFDRLLGLIDHDKVVYGGLSRRETLQLEPTVMDKVTFADKIMQEEIFGPIMPVIGFESLRDVTQQLHSMSSPLALYLFTSSRRVAKLITENVSFGGGCINDTIIHLASDELPFGGVGASGMGQYHGKAGFDTFTHYKGIVDKSTRIDLPMRYQPGSSLGLRLVKMFLR